MDDTGTDGRGAGRQRAHDLSKKLIIGGLVLLAVGGVANAVVFETGTLSPTMSIVLQTVTWIAEPMLTAGFVGFVLLALGVGARD